MINVRELRKSFGVIDAVRDLTFSVARGEVLGFLGPNGAGKSTTMKILTGFLPATAGEVEICGFDVRRQALQSRAHIGYLAEGAPLYGDMTPKMLLRFCADIRHMSAEKRRTRTSEVVDALELGPVLPQRIETLSKGYKRRVGFAQAILHDPDVLILDEPTDGLDPNQKHHVRQLIRAMGRDKAIIISTHLLEEVDAVCDRAVIIDRGRIVLEGTPAELHDRAEGAGAGLVRVRIADAATALRIIAGLPEVGNARELERDETSVLLSGTSKERAAPLAAMGIALVRAGIEPIELNSRSGSLDAVFREVTRPGEQTTTAVT